MKQPWFTTAYQVLLFGAGSLSLILPTASYACAVCGGAEDNGYFWGVLFLMSMPFTIASFVGGWLLYSYRCVPSDPKPSTPSQAIEGRTSGHASVPLTPDRPDDGHQAHHPAATFRQSPGVD